MKKRAILHFVNKLSGSIWFAALLGALSLHPASAQNLADYDYENLSFRGIGFDFGRIWPTKVEATSMYTLRFDLGYLGPGVRFVPSLSYWSSTIKGSELSRFANQLNRLPSVRDRGVTITPGELGEITWSDFSAAADAHLVWTTDFVRSYPYLGVGAALHMLNGHGDAVQGTFVEDLLDSTPAGVALMAGVEFQPLQTLRLYGEARYTMMSDLRYPALRIGGAFMLTSRPSSPIQGTQ